LAERALSLSPRPSRRRPPPLRALLVAPAARPFPLLILILSPSSTVRNAHLPCAVSTPSHDTHTHTKAHDPLFPRAHEARDIASLSGDLSRCPTSLAAPPPRTPSFDLEGSGHSFLKPPGPLPTAFSKRRGGAKTWQLLPVSRRILGALPARPSSRPLLVRVTGLGTRKFTTPGLFLRYA